MKLLLLFLTTLAATADLRLATFNIRFEGGDKGERSWENRRELVAATIKKIDPDVLGLQEALLSQVTFLEKQFPGYQRVGVGRKDGKKAGELPAIGNESALQLVSPALSVFQFSSWSPSQVSNWPELARGKSPIEQMSTRRE
ncbi:endonuclease/exonuclease/phosphatase family protein [bacterium]|nr:endonuclease/exonuclease/phosphatase family protein [Akkermansiaceae bacterium]MDB4407126.1 endonuclease/exonuclease/phosphatase family protein [bacterium]MDB4492297.1 endonuclease/exonuclease/phosphatase family protein [bacterium]